MKFLNGSELVEFIKERQATEVRRLKQALKQHPKLAVVVTVDNPIINSYINIKQSYGDEIGIIVDIHRININDVDAKLSELNSDDKIHGIIVQLPVSDISRTDEIVTKISPDKDVDGLGENPSFDPATPKAILWLLAAYNVDLPGKNILVVGEGRLVGKPLVRMFRNSDLSPTVVTEENADELPNALIQADIVITATGRPFVISSDMLHAGQVIIDAGVASEDGRLVGDVDESVYESDLDIKITPRKGGVGPLTVAALFDNVLLAARNRSESK